MWLILIIWFLSARNYLVKKFLGSREKFLSFLLNIFKEYLIKNIFKNIFKKYLSNACRGSVYIDFKFELHL